MTKTLRITVILASAAAVVFLVFSVFFGSRIEAEYDEYLRSEGAIEHFKKSEGKKVKRKDGQVSPLVKEAVKFALYLNPPKVVKKSKTASKSKGSRKKSIPRPKSVSTKFKLIGTCYYSGSPELSLALIDEPGKGLQWVRLAGKIGHLVIEDIQDGVVVVKDGNKVSEIAVERPKKISLLKGEGGAAAAVEPESLEALLGMETAKTATTTAISDSKEVAPKVPEISIVRDAESLGEMLALLQADVDANLPGGQEEKAQMEELMEFIRINQAEAEKLGNLGEDLEKGKSDPLLNRRAKRREEIERARKGTPRRRRKVQPKSATPKEPIRGED